MSISLVIGIDPGKGGGLAFIPSFGAPWTVKMPETDRDLLDVLQGAKKDWPDAVAYLERVSGGAFGGQRMAGGFTFGEGFGALKMALTASGIPFELVLPQKWQKALSCMTGGDKNVTKRKAQQLFPDIKITHANADALLIAEYGRRATL